MKDIPFTLEQVTEMHRQNEAGVPLYKLAEEKGTSDKVVERAMRAFGFVPRRFRDRRPPIKRRLTYAPYIAHLLREP